MTIYLDLVFFLNCLSDGLGLYITGRLAGLMLKGRRILAAAGLGGLYGALCGAVPNPYGYLLPRTVVAAGMVRLAYGRGETNGKLILLFFLVSCILAGVPLTVSELFSRNFQDNPLYQMSWKVFLLACIFCYIVLSLLFHGGLQHHISGEICGGRLTYKGRSIEFTALQDSGHTLKDYGTGKPVLIIELQKFLPLLNPEEQKILKQLPSEGPVWCMSQLGAGAFKLLPYRAVGVSSGLLLCLRTDSAEIDGQPYGALTAAISPTPVSEIGGYAALWGGDRRQSYAA